MMPATREMRIQMTIKIEPGTKMNQAILNERLLGLRPVGVGVGLGAGKVMVGCCENDIFCLCLGRTF